MIRKGSHCAAIRCSSRTVAITRYDASISAVAWCRHVLGTGRAGRSRPDGNDGSGTAMNSPIDLAVIGDDLHVAVAGQNQIWSMDLGTGRVSTLAGDGELGLADGVGAAARLAQPSGLSVIGRHLVVADSAASAIRLVDVDSGAVETLVGVDLYESGDVNGRGEGVRLQNPLAVATDIRGLIYIADTYNHSIKVLSRKSGELRPLRHSYRLNEPQGVGLSGNRLWVANTNLHEIACIDLVNGKVRRVPVAED